MLSSLFSALISFIVTVVVLFAILVAWKGGRGAVVWLLDVYRRFNLAVLAFRGATPSSEAERRVVSGQAWAGATRAKARAARVSSLLMAVDQGGAGGMKSLRSS